MIKLNVINIINTQYTIIGWGNNLFSLCLRRLTKAFLDGLPLILLGRVTQRDAHPQLVDFLIQT